MTDSWNRQSPPRLVGYTLWLYQMPRIDSSGEVLVPVSLPKDAEDSGEPPNRWLIVLGDITGTGETDSLRKDALETVVIRLVGITTGPASILKAFTSDLVIQPRTESPLCWWP